MAKYLYGLSIQGIQEFIFTTNELKSIVGASELIKKINDKVKEKGFEKNIIINAAGNIKLIFEENERDKLEKLVLDFPKELHQASYGLTISQTVVSFEEGKLKEAFEELEKRLFIQRNKASLPLDMSINLIKNAPKTARPMVEAKKDMATILKEEASLDSKQIPKNRKNKTAIIHIDGNGLGAMIASMLKDLKNDAAVIDAYKEFSSKLEDSTTSAFNLAKEEIPEDDIRDVICGGDDVTVVCNANYALEFTQKFLTAFEKKTAELLGKDGLSACSGIAFCHHKYPFHYAVNLAESLCSYAKSISREKSSLMFHNIQSSNFSSFEEYIDKELTIKDEDEKIFLYYGPYFIEKNDTYASVEDFLNLSKALALKGSPLSRWREWLTILSKDKIAAEERLKRIEQMMDLRDDIYKKSALVNALKQFNQGIKLDELVVKRGDVWYTPVGDINTYLSVTDGSK